MTAERNTGPRVTGPRVTGLGGVFYVVKDPEATRAWYRDTLGIDGPYGPQFDWADEPLTHPYSLISHFSDDSYIKPGAGGFMINLRVNDCAGLAAALHAKGVEILGESDEGTASSPGCSTPTG